MRQLKPDCGVARPSLGWPNGFGRHGVTPSSLKQQEEKEECGAQLATTNGDVELAADQIVQLF